MYLLNASSANVGQVNRWQLISRLVKGDANLPGSWHKPIFRWKFLARTLVFPQVTLGLLSELAGNPQLGTLLQSQPDFPCKLHRPYLSANLTKRQGLQAIKDHYQLVNELMPTSLGLGYIQGSPFKLADVTGRHEQVFSLFLGTLPSLNKEGEATLMFANPQGEILALLTFNLMMYRQEKPYLLAGYKVLHRRFLMRKFKSAPKSATVYSRNVCCWKRLIVWLNQWGSRRLLLSEIVPIFTKTGVIADRKKTNCTPITMTSGNLWAVRKPTMDTMLYRLALPVKLLRTSPVKNALNTVVVTNC
ncbi:hypothetical protein BI323_01500 [Yersinia ruckeri]|nr:hypothetical protein BI323_01500 [Yersinia ruckeri]QTD76220.1 DUF535 domain-containing protein [Yersinia ruckeri]